MRKTEASSKVPLNRKKKTLIEMKEEEKKKGPPMPKPSSGRSVLG